MPRPCGTDDDDADARVVVVTEALDDAVVRGVGLVEAAEPSELHTGAEQCPRDLRADVGVVVLAEALDRGVADDDRLLLSPQLAERERLVAQRTRDVDAQRLPSLSSPKRRISSSYAASEASTRSWPCRSTHALRVRA